MEVKHDIAGQQFLISQNGSDAGELVYSIADKKMIIHHTGVDPAFRGTGVGRALVNAAISFAKEKQMKIVPKCSYAKAVLERMPDGDELIANY